MADLESSIPAGGGDALAAIEGYEATLQHIRLLQQKRNALAVKQRLPTLPRPPVAGSRFWPASVPGRRRRRSSASASGCTGI